MVGQESMGVMSRARWSNEEDEMNGQVLGISGVLERWANWRHELEKDGYVVVQATGEREGLKLAEGMPSRRRIYRFADHDGIGRLGGFGGA